MSSEALQGIGPKLAAAREAMGLSAAEVASKLRLGVRQVEALEADAFDQLPGEVFVRGFVRNYARLLELDPNNLLPSQEVAVAEQLTVPSTNVRFHPSPLQRWLLLPLGSAVLFFALVALLYAWLSSGEQAAVLEQPALEEHAASQQAAAQPPAEATDTTTPTSVDAGDVAPAPTADSTQPTVASPTVAQATEKTTPAPVNKPAVVDNTKPVVPPLASNSQASTASQAAPMQAKPAAEAVKPFAPISKPVQPTVEPPKAVAPVAPKPPSAPAPVAPVSITPVSKPAPPPLGPALAKPATEPEKPTTMATAAKPGQAHKLVFQPTEDSWIQVTDGSGQRFSKLIRAGSTESLNGTPPFRMVVGNAASMRLTHDGKVVDLKPFIGEKVARVKLSDDGASKMAPPASQNQ